MYWPLGAPRIYSANRKRRKGSAEDDDTAQEPGDVRDEEDSDILDLRTSRSGHLIATVTATSLMIWQASPIVVLAVAHRSTSSIRNYGPNMAVLLRPDASIAVVQTSNGFLVTYSLAVDPSTRVYQQIHEGSKQYKSAQADRLIIEHKRAGFREVNLKFRMVIRIDAGIAVALALDNEVVVATKRPAAVQCIRWTPDDAGRQTSTELTSRMLWLHKGSSIVAMVHDRSMSLAVWIGSDGRAYAVQKRPETPERSEETQRLFRGYEYHSPGDEGFEGIKAAINARFSLLAIGCRGGEIHVYTAKDYVGSIPLSHKVVAPASFATTGSITCLSYSPDGYCLVVGYEHGWAVFSAYGKPGANSFSADTSTSESNEERWLLGISDLGWINGGSDLVLVCPKDSRLWALEMTKSAVTTCFSSANIARTFLLSGSNLIIYRGFDAPIAAGISTDSSLWQQVPIAPAYLMNQRPIRSAISSHDGRYIAIAGKRGLAHYSVRSGRWKTFDDGGDENAFVVRGGMCWYQHVLIAAVETDDSYEVRLYSRELGLSERSLMHVEILPAAAVTISITGQDSLLVYTFENVLYHYIINTSNTTVSLVQVGQLALNGIVRAPARVRAVTWILPDFQLRDGDPSQDVAHASVLFLVDANLVLLQSSTTDNGPKYDMRVIAHNVEYFDLMRDQASLLVSPSQSVPESPSSEIAPMSALGADYGLRDSLWYFDGTSIQCWLDIKDLLTPMSIENYADFPPPVSIQTDFYPIAVVMDRGVVLGLDTELMQRGDMHFAMIRHSTRSQTQLFLPHILQRDLSEGDSAAASILALRYQDLPYFPHALEVLLHMVLDDEVDAGLEEEKSLLASVVSFLSGFPDYLDIIVQCTRKTEVRSWRTLFRYLPPPQQLFEESLGKGMLKTAGGYLLVLHTFQDLDTSSEQCIRLLGLAREEGDLDLCKELARFLMALDGSGDTLREALSRMDIKLVGEDANGESGDEQLSSLDAIEKVEQHPLNGNPPELTGSSRGESQKVAYATRPFKTGLGIYEDDRSLTDDLS
ncbi:MAG: hypothetical protein L6R37_005649 [Teloschistes peruensis]|nr:MAG: hypothetical protein L6R37_005649 [Teloschistes peruensis]